MMKKLIGVLVTITLAGIILFFLKSQGIPAANIESEGQRLSVVKGSYCWDGLIHQECVDTALPAELIEHNQMVPVIIAPEALITIHFSRNPRKKSVGVSQWLNDREAKTIQLKRNSFHAPKEEGLYIYSVHAGWPKGDVSYAFAVKVHK